jgi:hypothetical protein
LRENDAPRRLAWLSAAQRDLCRYCDCETWLPAQRRSETRLRARWDMPGSRSLACQLAFDYRMATVEHLRGRDGTDADRPGNLAMACAFCNSSRHDRTPEAHRIAMLALRDGGAHPCWPP